MDNINISELIKDMREIILIEDKIEKVEKFLELLPEEDILELMIKHNQINEEDISELIILINNIRPDLTDYNFYLSTEQNKINKVNTYIY